MSFLSELTAKKYWIISAIALIIVGFLIYLVVSFSNNAREKKLSELEALKEEAETQEDETIEILSVITGSIVSINDDSITLRPDDVILEEFPNTPNQVLIYVTNGIGIVERVEKERSYYHQEFLEYEQELRGVLEANGQSINDFNIRVDGDYGFDVPAFPDPYFEYILDLKDLEIGDIVSAEGAADVIGKEEFEAVVIIKNINTAE